MANGYDIQQWNAVRHKAEELGLAVGVSGDRFVISNGCGIFNSVGDVYHFLCGYEAGISAAPLKSVSKAGHWPYV